MMKLKFSIFLLFFNLNLQSQIVDVFSHSYNFGKVEYWKNDTAWFSITNAGKNELYFLKTFYNQEYSVFFEKPNLKQGENSRIGIILYNTETGNFSKDVFINVSVLENPIKFNVKGNIKEFHPDALHECPKVNDKAEEIKKHFVFEVRDFKTDKLLKPNYINLKSRLKIINLNYNDSVYETVLNPGQFRLEASKIGYEKYLAIISIEAYEGKFIIFLRKSEFTTNNSDTLETKITQTNLTDNLTDTSTLVHNHPISIALQVNKDTLSSKIKEDKSSDTIKIENTSTDNTIVPNEFDSLKYKFNNLIFVIDISSSMKNENKIEELKRGLNNLIQLLRKQDKLTIIAYSGSAEVVLQPTPGNLKDSMSNCLNRLKVGGASNGSAALELAYNLGQSNYIKEGNNQVLIATDGIFNSPGMSKKATISYVREMQLKTNINLSCLALGNNDKAILFLNELSNAGNGSFLNISNSYNLDQSLGNLIKAQSKR